MKIISKKILFLSIYLIIIIITNEFYRNYLFKYSYNSFEEKIQKSFCRKIDFYFYFFTYLGNEYGLIPVFLISFIISIKFFFIIFSIFCFSLYWNGIFKLIYYYPRPFWKNNDLFKYCETGYGNPSGHSMISTIFYLGIIEFICQSKYFKNYSIIKFRKLFSLFLIYNIMFSRIYFGVHSIDQVLYGHFLGLGLYYLVFEIIELHKYNSIKFIVILLSYKLYIILLYLFSISISFLFLIFIDYDSKNKEFKSNLKEQCPNSKEYRIFHYESYYTIFRTFLWFGAFLGYIFLNVFIDIVKLDENLKMNYNSFKDKIKIKIFRSGIMFLTVLPSLLFYFLNFESIPKIFLFNTIIPSIIQGFLLFGPGNYFGILFVKKYLMKNYEDYNNVEPSIDI